MAVLLKGAAVAAKLTEISAAGAAKLKELGVSPTLAIVRLGEREDDMAYERGAMKRCAQTGIEVKRCSLDIDTTQEQLLDIIEQLNRDDTIHGVLIMRPLPKHINDAVVTSALAASKDVDGITGGSMASLYSGTGKGFAPCTAQACVEILKHYGIPLEGKRAVVVGRSLVIGKPVSQLLLNENMTVTTCHSRSQGLADICREADVIIAAAGKAQMITAEFVKEGQTVIDVGIHDNGNGGLCGDVKTDEVSEKVYAVTPVPGGVGAVTTSVLAAHVVAAAEKLNSKEK